MRRVAYLAPVMVLALGIGSAFAQGEKTESFFGVVKSVSGNSITVERGTMTGIFTFDAKTHVGARGATAATKAAKESGKAGLTVPDAVKVGDQVTVKFKETKAGMIASDITVRPRT